MRPLAEAAGAAPIEGVLFDFNFTLVHQGEAHDWLELARQRVGRRGTAAEEFGADGLAEVLDFLDQLWVHARGHDPDSRRDSGPEQHRAVYDLTMAGLPLVDPELRAAIYDCLLDVWTAYTDAAAVLKSLQQAGIRVAVLSNIGFDIRPVLVRDGLSDLVDAVVLSYEVGAVKPQPAIFEHALAAIGVGAGRALMVGDSWQDDAGAAGLGVRTLILPRTTGPVHGLDAVLRLAGLRP